MNRLARCISISIAAGAGLVALEYVIARLVPPLGVVFYLPTLVGLSILEDQGLPTLQGSPDGWPIPTTYGWLVSASIWWLLWSVLAGVYLWRKWVRHAL